MNCFCNGHMVWQAMANRLFCCLGMRTVIADCLRLQLEATRNRDKGSPSKGKYYVQLLVLTG